jgi:DNA-binding transcriptional MerR regulator
MPARKLETAPESDSVEQPDRDEKDLGEKAADAFRTIGEAAAELGLKTHVLRFWETKFDALKPLKRPDGRRYYRAEDMEVLRTLQKLLHVQGLTIRGAVKVLRTGEVDPAEADAVEPAETIVEAGHSVRDLQDVVREAVERGDFQQPEVAGNGATKARLESLLADLTGLKSRLDAVRAG